MFGCLVERFKFLNVWCQFLRVNVLKTYWSRHIRPLRMCEGFTTDIFVAFCKNSTIDSHSLKVKIHTWGRYHVIHSYNAFTTLKEKEDNGCQRNVP